MKAPSLSSHLELLCPILMLIVFASPASLAQGLPHPADTSYDQGMASRANGDWESAMKTWQSAREALDSDGRVDPRIGFAFIEVAVEQQLEHRFGEASEMYFWSLSQKSWTVHKKSISAEVERVLPLLTDEESKRWRALLKADDASILSELRQFWVERDPVLSTAINERLIEHWQRIAHSRKKFKKGGSSAYGTDDRGLIYVKYGPPDREHLVMLGTNTTELMTWAPLADFSRDAFSFGSASSDFVQLRNAMEFYLTSPECELWVYSEGLKTDEPVLFLFGPDDGQGSFGLRDGVEDMIPNSAFSKANLRKTGGLLPGGLLQMMYYGKLSLYDSSFEDRYSELQSAWLHAESFARQALRAGMTGAAQSYISNNLTKELKGIRAHYEMKDRLNPARRYAAAARSDFDTEINSINLSAYGTRVLSESQPYMIVMAYEFERIFRRGQSFKFPSYDFRHQLKVRDSGMSVIEQQEASPVHANSNTVVYKMPHQGNHANYTVALETFLKDDELDSARVDQPISVGQVSFEAEPVLAVDKTSLEASDLVLGIHPPKPLRDVQLPFPIVPSSRFFRLETLQVYLELYHLALDESGNGRYSLDFRVTRLEIDNEKVQRKEMVATLFEFDTFSNVVKETFRIDISKLKSGDYEMLVEIQDRVSSQKRQRSRSFQILDSDGR